MTHQNAGGAPEGGRRLSLDFSLSGSREVFFFTGAPFQSLIYVVALPFLGPASVAFSLLAHPQLVTLRPSLSSHPSSLPPDSPLSTVTARVSLPSPLAVIAPAPAHLSSPLSSYRFLPPDSPHPLYSYAVLPPPPSSLKAHLVAIHGLWAVKIKPGECLLKKPRLCEDMYCLRRFRPQHSNNLAGVRDCLPRMFDLPRSTTCRELDDMKTETMGETS
ncbi:hypothetical protein FB451DRAFT_1565938 [Mycena latifolia]|nr:hypothetical protein FB451DRAFT_1565938 [Mycena latifolia]